MFMDLSLPPEFIDVFSLWHKLAKFDLICKYFHLKHERGQIKKKYGSVSSKMLTKVQYLIVLGH